MAKTNPIASLFGHSPIKPMQKHIEAAVSCASRLPDLFDAMCAGDQAKVAEIKDAIFELEEQADQIKNDLRGHLPKGLFMAVDRRDLLDILDEQDAIADTAQDIAGLVTARPMDVPEAMKDPLKAFVRRCIDACDQSSTIINELDELISTGFGGRESDKVSEMVEALNKIESDTDMMGVELTQHLFAHEDEMKPVSVMFWYQLIHAIGNVADHAERVGNRLRLMLAK
jgi:predicted phosphate transport protein (TIGR00153 family)